MKINTIGYSGKTAEEFFELLKKNKIDCLVDIRIYPNHEGAMYASKRDLPYLLKEIANINYKYLATLAPTPQLLDDIHMDNDFEKYTRGFAKIMAERNVPFSLDKNFFEKQICCLMCFEATAEFCHRRLAAELIQKHWDGVEIIHL